MRLRSLVVLVLFAGCDATISAPPRPLPPVDLCLDLKPLTAIIVPDTISFNGAATVTATGGTGRYTYAITSEMAAGSINGTRYVADHGTGTDTVTVTDDCGNFARVAIEVTAAFSVSPSRARVAPGTQFTMRVSGNKGTVRYSIQGGALPSGGTLSATGDYKAGATAATDVVLVRDSVSGEQVGVVIEVSPNAKFAPAAARYALPTGTFVPLGVVDGTGVVAWSIKSGPGSLENRAGTTVYVAPETGEGTAELEAHDELLDLRTTVKVRLLTELTRPGLPAQGRRSDTATLVTGDFDGDGIDDVALGVPESDLAKPQGGAVFIFKGTTTGLPDVPTWTIVGTSDTAQFGSVMAAGDLDGDGHADLAISAPGDDLTVADSGAVYLYTITAMGPRQLRAPLTGLGRGNFGASLAIADVDGDGDNDLIVGSPGADIGGGFTARGVIDIFQLTPGQPVPDLGAVRLGGQDLDPDGGIKKTSNVRAGRALVAADLNGDSRVDLAILTSVNNSATADGGLLSRNVIAAQVHFGRNNPIKPFEDVPDLYVTPANTGDGDEGTWRLGVVPATAGRGVMLAVAADRADSPDLRANDGGTAGGGNAGAVYLFDLNGREGVSPVGNYPAQVSRLGAFARVFGDQTNIQASRSFSTVDADGDGNLELVMGAPYATTAMADGGTLANAGRLEFFSLASLSRGAVVNRPQFSLNGRNRTDVMGTAVVGWGTRVVTFSGRATTPLGDFTGRMDAYNGGSSDPLSWTSSAAPIPSRPASQQFGLGIEVGAMSNGLRAVVGVPNISGPSGDNSGGETGAGQALTYSVATPASAFISAEGANASYVTDAGTRAFGGRTIGVDVALTDFDGDGKLDAVIAAPNFSQPTRAGDGGVNTTDYALNRTECAPGGNQSNGAMLVHFGQNDGTFKEAVRVWALRDIAGCTVPDGGSGAICQRNQISRNGVVGGFDFNGDGKQDIGATRSNGFDVYAGGAVDDASLSKPSMACSTLFTFPYIGQTTSMPTALGDLNGDGCDEVGFRYSDNGNRQGAVIAFGFDEGGVRCGGATEASWLRISGDTETGLVTMRLGVAMARARDVLTVGGDAVAITADLYPFEGTAQPTVLLIPVTQILAKKPASGERLVSILADFNAVPLVPKQRALNFGRALAGNVDVDGDGKRDLVVSAPGANVNGDGTGAVFIFKGGTVVAGANAPSMVIAADHRERGAFGQDLSLAAGKGTAPASIGIGAPISYRSGTANGTAFVLPLDF